MGHDDDGPISFPELVWAHWRWERPLHADDRADPVLEAAARRKLRKFEAQEGKIEVVYWSTIDASAVALTVKRRVARQPVVRFHRATDWVTKHAPKVADLLFSYESLCDPRQRDSARLERVSSPCNGSHRWRAICWGSSIVAGNLRSTKR